MDATNPTLLAPATNAAIAADLEVKRPQNLLQTKHWLCSLPPLQLLAAAQKLADELAVLHGYGLHPANGCFHAECFLGDADVTVEYEHTGASGDGWNEPREDESITPLCAWINGQWVDAEKFDADVLSKWHEKGWERLKELAEAAEEDRAAAQYADRMERCG